MVESQKNVNVAANTNWGSYGPYYGYHWGFIYYSIRWIQSKAYGR